MKFQIECGDSAEVLKKFGDCTMDSMVTDPPAGIKLMNLNWDDDKGGRDQWIAWIQRIFEECHRVLKPGAHGFVWALPRTSHWTATALESSGFLIKDVVTHVFGSGFPKSAAVDKLVARSKYTNTEEIFRVTSWIRQRRDELGLSNRDLDRAAGVIGGACHWTAIPPNGQPHIPTAERWMGLENILGPAPEWMRTLIRPARERSTISEVSEWTGWGTSLKPASEHWLLVQKPISEHNLAANILKWGTGAINIDVSRISVRRSIPSTTNLPFAGNGFLWDKTKRSRTSIYQQHSLGRFPSNFCLTRDEDSSCPVTQLNNQAEGDVSEYFKVFSPEPFHYFKKANCSERNHGNTHPTIKPIKLMRYFCQMVTPPSGAVLDPFMGSGTTGVAALSSGFRFSGIEKDESYFEISKSRLEGV